MHPPTVLVDLSPSFIVSRIQEALACGLIAIVLSTTVYGITVLQAYMYFRCSIQDSVRFRSFVAFLLILDTASLVLAAKVLYEYVVTDFGKPWLFLKLPRALAFENGVTVRTQLYNQPSNTLDSSRTWVGSQYLIATLTQSFLAHRLWALSKGNVPLVSTIVILSFASFGVGIVVCVRNYTELYFLSLAAPEMLWLVGFTSGLSALCDVAITIGLLYNLNSKRTGFKRTDSIINRLILYAVNRGVLTAICQAGLTIAFVAFPGHLFHFPFDIMSGKLYCNTLLATLNAQKTMRMEDDNVIEVDSYILKPDCMHTSTAANGSSSLRKPSTGNGTPTHVIDISADNLKMPMISATNHSQRNVTLEVNAAGQAQELVALQDALLDALASEPHQHATEKTALDDQINRLVAARVELLAAREDFAAKHEPAPRQRSSSRRYLFRRDPLRDRGEASH
ncbi:hypothetical protein V8D89_009470 [Ganoderma adspersum]